MSEALLRRLAVRLDDVEALLTRLTGEVDDLIATVEASSAAAASATPQDPVAEPVFGAAQDWVTTFFTPVFVRTIGGEIRWCSRWAEHPEAVLRLEAMWRSWEVQRLDGGLGLSVWLLHHLDPGLAALTSRSGPFARCSLERHN